MHHDKNTSTKFVAEFVGEERETAPAAAPVPAIALLVVRVDLLYSPRFAVLPTQCACRDQPPRQAYRAWAGWSRGALASFLLRAGGLRALFCVACHSGKKPHFFTTPSGRQQQLPMHRISLPLGQAPRGRRSQPAARSNIEI
jgi:hypothetical protein